MNENLHWLGESEDQLDRIASLIENDEMDLAQDACCDLKLDFEKKEKNIEKTFELGNAILSRCHPNSISTVKHWLGALKAGWNENNNWLGQIENRLTTLENEKS